MELRNAIDDICSCDYPATSEEVEKSCGDSKIELRNGDEITLNEIFQRTDEPPEVFESEIELRNYMLCMAPEGSIGRKNYDDRGNNIDVRESQLSF
jgi:hypothetical protein